MNGDKEKVKWYLFKIPIKDYEKRDWSDPGFQDSPFHAYVYDRIP